MTPVPVPVVNEYEGVQSDVERIARQLHAQHQDEPVWDKLDGHKRDDYHLFAARVLQCPSVAAAFEAQAKLEALDADVVERWAEYRLVIRSAEYEYCSEWTRDYDTVLGWDNDSPPDWIVERRGVSVTPPQRPVTGGPEMVLVSADDLRLALGDVRTTNAPQPGDIPEGWSDARSRLRAAVRVEEGGES